MCTESAFYPIFRKLKMNEIYIIDNYIRHYFTSLIFLKKDVLCSIRCPNKIKWFDPLRKMYINNIKSLNQPYYYFFLDI